MQRLTIIVSLLALSITGCGFQAMLAKTHEGIKALSQEVEPKLVERCKSEIKKCKGKKIAKDKCTGDKSCRELLSVYVLTAKQTHSNLNAMNSLYIKLKKMGVIE